MTVSSDQMPAEFREVCEEQLRIYGEGRAIQVRNAVPDTTEIPLDDKRRWLKIPKVICVYVDMTRSTSLSASTEDSKVAGAYQLFTDTAVRLFDRFDAPYVEVQGDAAFALFDEGQIHRSLAAAVTIRTFIAEEFTPRLQSDTGLELKSRSGIDIAPVLVRKLGMRRYGGRSDRQNEVWAGKPVNMAAKLSSIAGPGCVVVSDRFHTLIKSEKGLLSCGCPDGKKVGLWSPRDVSTDDRFDFATAFELKSVWCKIHGADFCNQVLRADR